MKRKLTGLCAALISSLLLGGCWFFNTQESASIAIIGGADGPTAIFTATQVSPRVLLIAIPLVIIVAVVALWIFFYFRKKK